MRRLLACTVTMVAILAAGTARCDVSDGGLDNPVYYVSANRGHDNDTGLSWDHAKLTIQAAIDQAVYDEQIPAQVWVSAEDLTPTGTISVYQENVYTQDGVSVYGGFDGYEAQRSQRNWAEHVTVIKGWVATATIVFDGFTVDAEYTSGGGVSLLSWTPSAAVVACSYGVISHNVICAQTMGISVADQSHPIIVDNLIKGFSNCGVGVEDSKEWPDGCYIANNTIVSCEAPDEDSYGIDIEGNTSCDYYFSNVVSGPTTGIYDNQLYVAEANDLDTEYPGISGQDDDGPLFVDPDAGDYRLQPTSPCIDTGSAAEWDIVMLDLNHSSRLQDMPNQGYDGLHSLAIMDRGAYSTKCLLK